jgi:anti-sigma factor ChrR (cupin superfamily)
VKKPGTLEADLEAAALHALGALPEDERRDLEAALAVTPDLREELAAFRAVADDLALSATPVSPRPEVRERLLAEVAKRAAEPGLAAAAKPGPLPAFYFAHESTLPWTQIRPGVEVKDLTPGAPAGGHAILVRLAPGGVVKQHEHRFAEHCFVLSGRVSLVGEELKPGDYHLAAAGTTHHDFSSESGCLLLIVDGPPEQPTA